MGEGEFMSIEFLFSQHPYAMPHEQKYKMMTQTIANLTEHHLNHCPPYKNILQALPIQWNQASLENLPFLPVRLFKIHDFKSVPDDQVIKTLTSSGTTSQAVSRIFLNKETSMNQTKALAIIMQSFLGKKRKPMLLIDTPSVIKNRESFSARGAGLLGLTFMGRNHTYLLNEEMNINWNGLDKFIETHQQEEIIIFGFTFMIWKYFYHELKKNNRMLNLHNTTMIHSGGWKKLEEEKVTNERFKHLIEKQTGIQRIHNFYGMVEQVGSVFMECEQGYLHAPNFADVIIRHPQTLEPVHNGNQGIVQVVSVLPISYPGHNLLTEDLGTIWGEDDCKCGRLGKYFSIHGRLKAAELRGCSDTHAYHQG